MACEAKRGCGYRKAGGLYVRGEVAGVPVGWLPFCIDYPFGRGLCWAEPERLFRTCADATAGGYGLRTRVALMWVGDKFYTPESFAREAHEMGISKRVASLPRDLRPGDPLALAHIKAVPVSGARGYPTAGHCPVCADVPTAKAVANCMVGVGRHLCRCPETPACQMCVAGCDGCEPCAHARRGVAGSPADAVAGVFQLTLFTGVELVLPRSVANDPDIKRRCAAHGVTIVPVPDNDPDHVPPGWKLPRFLLDDEREPELPLEGGGGDAAAAAEDDEVRA